MSFGIIMLIIASLLVVGLIVIYNRLVALRQRQRQSYSDIDVQLKQRYDLIPNLIETVKGYAAHEKDVLQQVTDARVGIDRAGNSVAERAKAEQGLSQAMMNLFAVAENYPELKANETYQKLMDELSVIEDKIAAARRFFNSATQKLNTAIEQFPANLIAAKFGFTHEDYFEVDEATKTAMQEPPKVAF